jgi:hypothetical protein
MIGAIGNLGQVNGRRSSMVSSSPAAYSAAASLERKDGGISLTLLRWLILGAAALALFVVGVSHSHAVGAQSPYPPNTVISTYFDPRYCNGVVSVATDQYGNLIDICTVTGQRIYPVYPDYGYATPYYNAPAYVNANVYYNGAYGVPNYIYANNGCAVGNYSCVGYSYPYGYTGVYSGNYTVVAPNNNAIVVGPPYRVK